MIVGAPCDELVKRKSSRSQQAFVEAQTMGVPVDNY